MSDFGTKKAERDRVKDARRRAGYRNYLTGQAAEAAVMRAYLDRGMTVAHHRWRGKAGEIDLVLRDGAEVVFVEVKKSRSCEHASLHLLPRQIERLLRAGEEFVGSEPAGTLTPMRFDVALVDGQGGIQILENALGAY